MTRCRKCIVTGRVQGVFYRATTRDHATQLGLQGWAINLPDGSVEVIVCGASHAVDELCQWLWQGSEWSEVESVNCQELDATFMQQLSGTFSTG